MSEYPATRIVHWPTGPVPCCARHAAGLLKLGAFLGGHIVSTALTEPAECTNCVNEAKKALPP